MFDHTREVREESPRHVDSHVSMARKWPIRDQYTACELVTPRRCTENLNKNNVGGQRGIGVFRTSGVGECAREERHPEHNRLPVSPSDLRVPTPANRQWRRPLLNDPFCY